MSTILNVKTVSLKELPASIEKWEKYVRDYEEQNKTTLSDDVKTAALTDMCPNNLAQHIKLNYDRLNTYEKLRQEVLLYIQTQGPDNGGPVPMDIGALAEKVLASLVKSAGNGDRHGGPRCQPETWPCLWL